MCILQRNLDQKCIFSSSNTNLTLRCLRNYNMYIYIYVFISEEKDAIIFHVLKVSCPSRQSSARNEPLNTKLR